MKTNLRSLSLLFAGLAFAFTACKKEGSSLQEQTALATEVQAHADDQSSVSTNLDDVSNDVNVALEGSAFFGGRTQNTASICGGTAVVDTVSNPRTITITYNGTNCQGTHSRTGTVVLSMAAGVKWKNAGAAVTVNYQNLKVKRLSDNKSITLNGTQVHTNVSGGFVFPRPSLPSVVHTITSNNMSITFDDNSQRTWQVARKRTFTYDNGLVMTIAGIGTSGSVTNAAEWGTNRYGHAFTTSITQPLVFRQDCNGRLTAGEIKHEGFATAVATFGLNASGQPTACPSGSYYYKLAWTGPSGNTLSWLFPY